MFRFQSKFIVDNVYVHQYFFSGTYGKHSPVNLYGIFGKYTPVYFGKTRLSQNMIHQELNTKKNYSDDKELLENELRFSDFIH